ncbi:DUF1428 domain-containing protein [Aurantiacibacter sediminis]|uniref:DUF1428 domain-containing protein n=1 Tax=Aurantiacibacter sediminis TaxID=2793064 RepID=A0ABS0N5K8_9SPHN|nr:DUF1428 domain-containing protein [Aurantiacibacter sediminis]MBH5323089.1 DUF1428 domain-containing protein [Aurantiacibacter sediminis]
MYIQGFLLAVPEDKKAEYVAMAKRAATKFHEYGVVQIVEAWEDEIADGRVTDFRRATLAKEGERIVFSWMIWRDKAAYDASHEKMENDSFWKEEFSAMPFDGMRMMWGGFRPIVMSEAE